jgi:hypothetical protein
MSARPDPTKLVVDALRVLVLDHRIAAWLEEHDPKALAGAQAALRTYDEAERGLAVLWQRRFPHSPWQKVSTLNLGKARQMGHAFDRESLLADGWIGQLFPLGIDPNQEDATP